MAENKKTSRFEFGKNWQNFSKDIKPYQIENAVKSLKKLLHTDTMANKSFLDIGSGSGLFSLAARKLGASVNSFDFDRYSVNSTLKIKQCFFPDDPRWNIHWKMIKKLYNKYFILKFLIILFYFPYFCLLRYTFRLLIGKFSLERGMLIWHDMIDWLGGYPFETAKPEQVFSFFHQKRLVLDNLITAGGKMGCNEFVFRKTV